MALGLGFGQLLSQLDFPPANEPAVTGGRRQPDTGPSQETRLQSAALSYASESRQNAGLQFSYRFNEHRQGLLDADQPIRTHAVDLGTRLERRLSPTRRMSFSFGGGATRTWSQPLLGVPQRDFTLPTAFGSARVNIIRQWMSVRRCSKRRFGARRSGTRAFCHARYRASTRRRDRFAIAACRLIGRVQGRHAIDVGFAFDTTNGTVQIQCRLLTIGGPLCRLHPLRTSAAGSPSGADGVAATL